MWPLNAATVNLREATLVSLTILLCLAFIRSAYSSQVFESVISGSSHHAESRFEVGVEQGPVTVNPNFTPSATSVDADDIPSFIYSDWMNNADDDVFAAASTVNLFVPVATNAPSGLFGRTSHPLQPLGMTDTVISQSTIPTNNFYTNLFIGDRSQPANLYPYTVWWNQGNGGDFGLAISHTTKSQRVYGPIPDANPVRYYINPVGIRSISLSAAEFDASMTMSLNSPSAFSINVTMSPSTAKYGSSRSLTIPLVQGTGFISGVYYNLQPQFSSLVGFKSLTAKASPRSGVHKYVAELYDGTYWAIYATVPSGQTFSLSLLSSSTIKASARVNNVLVQIAKVVNELALDNHAGMYATGATVFGIATGNQGTYTINYSSLGSSNAGVLLLFALPHHVTSFYTSMKSRALGFTMDCQTKGIMYAYSTNQLVMTETLPTEINFAPWTSIPGKSANYTMSAIGLISEAALFEVMEDFGAQTNLDSMYFAGKALDKFAMICYVSHFVLRNIIITNMCLTKLKAAFAVFATNSGTYPLLYDNTYKGIISSAAISTGNSMADFGNTYYNDHHFHYGYHIHAAAVIGYIDKDLGGTWIANNKDYVNALVRDVANPSPLDRHFPFSRSFSWFHGHSWAKGLFESADGKDEESSSEDYHHAYAIKLWGQVVGDASMEARGAMMLAIMRRAMNSYMLMDSTNTIQPSNFIANKVTGIVRRAKTCKLFENKADHTTYFGTNIQYVQGIHMIPITPVSSYIRSPRFVQQEWTSLLASVAPTLTDGWKGILYANLALFDPTASYRFFTSSSFNNAYLDGGASLTWYLAYVAGVGGTTA
ncbi:endo-1,3(4)-beta-glucanase [Lipomyces kononenkoae]|uniref:Endo-1,3(4)-beta-glucanase n=1 Tax=Lipomyces kononenkoae TaxID=34357 RepID=A0ACC3T6A5_LIPKO